MKKIQEDKCFWKKYKTKMTKLRKKELNTKKKIKTYKEFYFKKL